MAEIKAIVYESNTGYTKQYAEMLSAATGLPAISTIEKTLFGKRDAVIFMGWICAGKINGLRLAKVKYNPMIIVGVGMTRPSNEYAFDIAMQNNIDGLFFYLQGGIHRERLKGFYKLMFKAYTRPYLRKSENGKSQLSKDEIELVDTIKNGNSFVKAENLTPIIEKYEELKNNQL